MFLVVIELNDCILNTILHCYFDIQESADRIVPSRILNLDLGELLVI